MAFVIHITAYPLHAGGDDLGTYTCGGITVGVNVGDVVSVLRPRRLRSCEGENEGEQQHGCP